MTNSVKIVMLVIAMTGITTFSLIKGANDKSGGFDTHSETPADVEADPSGSSKVNAEADHAGNSEADAEADHAGSSAAYAANVTSAGATAEYKKISSAEAKTMMDDRDVIILDVRTEAEYAEAHIPGAVLLPDSEVGERAAELLPDKDSVILVYCRSGGRSAGAARKLVGMGYTKVYDFGGIIDWPYNTVN